jgi:membrane-associated phospholipid phosphatase
LPGPYDVDGNLREEWVEEHRELVLLAHQQQDGNCWRCRAESEYWELGDEFPYPSGWWVQRAADIARDASMGVKESLQLVFGVAITVFDAGIAAWEMKYHYDSVRPVTTINEMFEGSEVSDWRGNRTANIDDKDHWRPYQLRRNIVPPFPEAPSGHSAFSTSSSVVLRNLLDTNVFDFVTEPFNSRFDLTDGFDGDPDNGNEDVVLEFKTFSQAADAAGFSRLYGGIHPMTGNVVGLNMGARVGHLTLTYLREIFGDDALGRDPIVNVWDDIVFGTGKDDDLHADCVPGSLMEVYGFYGDDGAVL